MATDYIVFIHGVNTREYNEPPTYADELFTLIQKSVTRKAKGTSTRKLVKVPLYWGSEGISSEKALLREYQYSHEKWNKFWFKKMRDSVLIEFSGDVALYMSRYVGARVADKLKTELLSQMAPALQSPDPDDRVHLVGHSLGTVVLFDILFSARWDQEDIPGHDSVKAIREGIYGVEPNWDQGMRLASISTMGSPLGLFSLMDVDTSTIERKNGKNQVVNTHDITPRLQQFLERIPTRLGSENRRLPWLNFAHPGDPLASPLDPLMVHMVDQDKKYVEVEDVILKNATLSDHLFQLINNSPLTLLHAGAAHLSYLKSKEVAERIARLILASTCQMNASSQEKVRDMVK